MAAGLISGYRAGLTRPRTDGPRLATASAEANSGNPFGADQVNLLLVGTDAGDATGRTDTVIMVCLDLPTNHLGVISLPRDTRVRLAGRGWHKLNAAYRYGGRQLLAQAVADVTEQPIDHVVRCDLAGFQQVVDALGGVRLKVEKRMRYDDHAQNLHIDLQPGEQLLDGQHAMQFVRFRKDAEGDLGRMRRQQVFLRALAKAAADPQHVFRLPGVIRSLSKHVDSTMGTLQTGCLLRLVRQLDLAAVPAIQLPGAAQTIDGSSYFVAAGDAPAAVARLKQSLAAPPRATAAPAPGQPAGPAALPEVTVYNGSDRVGLDRVVTQRLRRLGYAAVTAPTATVAQSGRTRVYATGSGAAAATEQVAKALQLSTHAGPCALRPQGAGRDGVPQVVVVLGADFPGR